MSSGAAYAEVQYDVVASFATINAEQPLGGVTLGADGALYGTTHAGGTGHCGVIYRAPLAGTLTAVHHFDRPDGCGPVGDLLLGPDGAFYGVTYSGGAAFPASQNGTVFRWHPTTGFTVVHRFQGGPDGIWPYSGLTLAPDGKLYGVTQDSMLYRVTPGSPATLALIGKMVNGGNVQAAVIVGDDGLLYGTNSGGGSVQSQVYRVSTTGAAYEPLFTFTGDPAPPYIAQYGSRALGELVEGPDGNFYGTTSLGGPAATDQGTVFKLTPQGTLVTLKVFSGNPMISTGYPDGSGPWTGLTLGSDGFLYGTTSAGGAHANGTIFRMSTSGDFTVLRHQDQDGFNPTEGRLLEVTPGVFYGAMTGGNGGVVFRLTTTNVSPDDLDGDLLKDVWETTFGLSPTSPSGNDGGAGDPDGDGLTNLQEQAAGTHPRGFYRRYLAEGAINSFFDLRLALLNVGSASSSVQLRFLQPGGGTVSKVEQLPAGRRRTLMRADIGGLTFPEFSTVVESDQPVVLDRTMWWDATGYGSHAETGVLSPSTTWYLAEGSTSGDFSLFYLLQNPNATAATATVRYLLPFGLPPIERTYPLPASSRATIPVDGEQAELSATDVSAVITSTLPIIAERAMYKSTPTQAFAAGHGSAGVTAPSTHWFLAEGATGPFFDMFVLLANPNLQQATVTLDYLLSDGTTTSKAYGVPGNGRITIWVDAEEIPAGSSLRPLDNVAVSTTIASDVPIIVERTMWWPSPATSSNYWTEAHNSPGATETGTRWALAEGEVGGPQAAETYVLIANTSAFAGSARVTLYFEDGTSAVRVIGLGPKGRTTVNASADFPEAAGKRFGTLIESLGATPAQVVVERAMYTSPDGVTWAAGTNALATKLP